MKDLELKGSELEIKALETLELSESKGIGAKKRPGS